MRPIERNNASDCWSPAATLDAPPYNPGPFSVSSALLRMSAGTVEAGRSLFSLVRADKVEVFRCSVQAVATYTTFLDGHRRALDYPGDRRPSGSANQGRLSQPPPSLFSHLCRSRAYK